MREPDAGARQRVIDYYRHWESRWGYALLLRGTKHFGWYPPGRERIRMAAAQTLMSDQLGRALALPAGRLALDAGCGQGGVALRLAEEFGLRVEGVDILQGDIRRASRKAARRGAGDRVRFQVMDYGRLRFPDGHFDGVYTMETLVHAADSRAALAQFHRVLRPGGRLVLFEYSLAPRRLLTARQRQAFDAIIDRSAMHSLPTFVHGCFPALLQAAGFEQVAVQDVTERMLPMLRRLARRFWLPYQLSRALRLQRQVVNAMSAVESWRHRAVWRYNIVTAAKPRAPDQ
jgi:cyclopropane fatty-acyl-phospholipid synthase-like methyltransferase